MSIVEAKGFHGPTSLGNSLNLITHFAKWNTFSILIATCKYPKEGPERVTIAKFIWLQKPLGQYLHGRLYPALRDFGKWESRSLALGGEVADLP